MDMDMAYPLNGWNGMEEGYYSFTPFPRPPSGMMFDGGTVKGGKQLSYKSCVMKRYNKEKGLFITLHY
jgi:hypothetical protein